MLENQCTRIATYAKNILHQRETRSTTKLHSGAVNAKCPCVKKIGVTPLLAGMKVAYWSMSPLNVKLWDALDQIAHT